MRNISWKLKTILGKYQKSKEECVVSVESWWYDVLYESMRRWVSVGLEFFGVEAVYIFNNTQIINDLEKFVYEIMNMF